MNLDGRERRDDLGMDDLEEQRAALRIQLELERRELEVVRGEKERLSAECEYLLPNSPIKRIFLLGPNPPPPPNTSTLRTLAVIESQLNSSSPPSPTTLSLSTPHSTLAPFKDNPALRKMASTYLLSEKEQGKIKRKKANNRKRREEEVRACIWLRQATCHNTNQ